MITWYSPKQRCWPWAGGSLAGTLWGVLWAHVSVCIKYQHLWADTTHSHAVSVVGTQKKYYSSDNDFLSASKCVTANLLCHLHEDSRFRSACRGKHIHKTVFVVSVEAAFGSVYPEPVLDTQGPLSELIPRHWHDQFFLKKKSSYKWARKGSSVGEFQVWASENTNSGLSICSYISSSALVFCCVEVALQCEKPCSCWHTVPHWRTVVVPSPPRGALPLALLRSPVQHPHPAKQPRHSKARYGKWARAET